MQDAGFVIRDSKRASRISKLVSCRSHLASRISYPASRIPYPVSPRRSPGELRLQAPNVFPGAWRAVGVGIEGDVARKPNRIFVDEVVQADPIRVPVAGEVTRGQQCVATGQLYLVPIDHVAAVDRQFVQIGIAVRVKASGKCRVAEIAVDALILDVAGKAVATGPLLTSTPYT